MKSGEQILTEFNAIHAVDPARAAQLADREFLALADMACGKNGATSEQSVRAAETIADLLLGDSEGWPVDEDGRMPVPSLRSRAIHVLERLRRARNGH